MLEIDRLAKRYADGTVALHGVDLVAAPGEILTVIGGSGCGKSTMLRLIAGLDAATLGEVRLDGERIDGPHAKVGMVFQEPRLMPWLDVARNVGFGLGHLAATERKARVAAALYAVGLDGRAGLLPRQLSGGMAQRVALARALVTKPAVLLMDEPFSAVDALTRERLQDHLLKLWEAGGPTLILVTHDVDEALALGDRVVVMRGHGHGIERIVEVPFGRPRRRTTESFQRLKETVTGTLHAAMSYVPPPRSPALQLIASRNVA